METITVLENGKPGPEAWVVEPTRVHTSLPAAVVEKLKQYSRAHGISQAAAWALAVEALTEKEQTERTSI